MPPDSGSPRLYLHIGPPKTGTSAIQHILRDHDDSVVFYPKRGLWGDGAHHGLVFNFYGDFARPEVERLELDAIWKEIGAGARACGKSTVVSSEILFDCDLKPFFEALLGALGLRVNEAEIVVAVREPYARAASAYNQVVKDAHTSEQRSPDQYLRDEAPKLVYAPRLGAIAGLGARVKLIAYEPNANLSVASSPSSDFQPSGFPLMRLETSL